MTQWLQRHLRRAFLASYSEQERALTDMLTRIQTMRGHLFALYEEVELAIRALDMLGERVDSAKARIRDRVQAEANGQALTPTTFTHDHRQRAGV